MITFSKYNLFYIIAKSKKSKGKKKKNVAKDNEEIINVVPPSVPEVVELEPVTNTVSILYK